MGSQIAHVRFINPDKSVVKGPDTCLYVYSKGGSGKWEWVYEFLADSKGHYQNVPLFMGPNFGQDKRSANGPSPTVQLVVGINGKPADLRVVCAPRQLSWNKAKETAKHADRGAKVAAAQKLKSADKGAPAGTWVVVVDPSGDSLTESGKCELGAIVPAGGKRAPGPEKKIQIVAVGNQKDSFGFGTKIFDDCPKGIDLNKKIREAGGVGKYLEGLKPPEKKPESWKFSSEKSFAYYAGGAVEFTPELLLETRCTQTHIVQVGGSAPKKQLKSKEPVRLEWKDSGSGALQSAKPSLYSLTAKGCSGKSQSLTVEVFPSDQYLFSWSMSADRGLADKVGPWFEGLKKLFKKVAKLDLTWGVKGGIDVLVGWREDSSWKAYHATEVKFSLTVKAGFKITLSVAQCWGIPQDVSDYIADIRLTIGLEGSLGGAMTLEARNYTDGKHLLNTTGAITAGLAIPLQLEGFVGKKGLLGASIRGELKPGINGKGQLNHKPSVLTLTISAGYDKAEIQVKAQLDALIWKREYDVAKVLLWNAGDFGKFEKPWDLTSKQVA